MCILSNCLPTYLITSEIPATYIVPRWQGDTHNFYYNYTTFTLQVPSFDDLMSEQCLCYAFPLNYLSFHAFLWLLVIYFITSYFHGNLFLQLHHNLAEPDIFTGQTIAFMFINLNIVGLHLTYCLWAHLAMLTKNYTPQEIIAFRYCLLFEYLLLANCGFLLPCLLYARLYDSFWRNNWRLGKMTSATCVAATFVIINR